MKTTGIKSWFRDVIALPILLAILIVETIDVALRHVLARVNIKAFIEIMDKPTPWGSRAATLDRETTKPEPPTVEGIDHAAAFLTELEAGDKDAVAGARLLLERTKVGKEVAALRHGVHDYAVAVPTKNENLRRIANVFAAMSDRVRGDIVDVMRHNPEHWKYGAGDSQES